VVGCGNNGVKTCCTLWQRIRRGPLQYTVLRANGKQSAIMGGWGCCDKIQEKVYRSLVGQQWLWLTVEHNGRDVQCDGATDPQRATAAHCTESERETVGHRE
jgi:hypothetical protein